MSRVPVAPDTGILLAYGYGPEVDPGAPAAIEAINLASRGSAELVLLGSVAQEFSRKLGELDAIAELLQRAVRELPAVDDLPPFQALEEVMSRLRSEGWGKTGRYIDAIERQAAVAFAEDQDASVERVLSDVLTRAGRVRQAVEFRVNQLQLRSFDVGPPAAGGSPKEIPGLGGFDLKHVEACYELAKQQGGRAIFLVLEARLQSIRDRIGTVYPGVTVTNPVYLARHIAR